VACLSVVVYHAGFALGRDEVVGVASAGWVRWGIVAGLRLLSMGVPLFFVISGYCIAASADSSCRRGLSSWSFLRRRFRRIYPPYWMALLGVVALTLGLDAAGLGRWHRDVSHALRLGSPGAMGWSQWVGNLTLTETWRPLAWGVADHEPYTRVAWTLCYEEQFYFACFVMLWLAPRRLGLALAGLSAAAMALRVWAWRAGALGRLDGTFPMLWHEFAVGLVVYWRLNVARGRAAGWIVAIGLAALAVIGMRWGMRQTAGAGVFGLVLIALRRFDGLAESRSWIRFLGACGRRCYSIYLAHLPVCTVSVACLLELGLTGFWTRTLVLVPAVSLLATAAGWAFFALVETHFLAAGGAPSRSAERAPGAPPHSMAGGARPAPALPCS
jgi:peptidoglycan/LPS O-acetylase OafA/YrhL